MTSVTCISKARDPSSSQWSKVYLTSCVPLHLEDFITFFTHIGNRVKRAFNAAIKDFNDKTCVRFAPRGGERSYVEIVSMGG